MPKLLKVLHLMKENGMPQVQIRRGRIKADLNSKRFSFSEAAYKLLFGYDFRRAPFYKLKIRHRKFPVKR
jgi:hypothetical protein